MNELIEQLWEKLSIIEPESLCSVVDIDGLTQAIQTACKAQRNACFSAYYDHIHDTSELIIAEILTAEITEEDYE